MICSACVAEVPDEDLFCENCGAKLAGTQAQVVTPATGCSCGAGVDEVDEDGFCTCCGKRVRRPVSDHVEQAISPEFAAVSDRGLRHDRNEDRFAIAQEGNTSVLVVCDGVSTTSNSEDASAVVADTVLHEALQRLEDEGAPDAAELLRAAIAEASSLLSEQAGSREDDRTPSTTVVAALVAGDEIVVAWAGDSRAYWLDAAGALALTRDHSWLAAAVAEGRLSEEEASLAPQAHAITRWIGADADPEAGPEIVRHGITRPGLLLLCSDGLWNYLPDAAELAQLVAGGNGDEDALTLAQRLTQFALDQGGRDNVTVAALRLEPSRAATEDAVLD